MINKFDFIQELTNSHTNPNKADITVCKAVISTMPTKELRNVQSYCCEVIDYVQWCEAPRAPKLPKHYKSWKVYFDDLKQRKRGVYSKSRQCLFNLFPYIEWSGQLQILNFLITSPIKTERLWACKHLISAWNIVGDLSYKKRTQWYNLIIQSWQKNNDVLFAEVIVKHFPVFYVEQNAEQLISQYNYKQVAIRLSELPYYKVEQDKLAEEDYLYVMAKIGEDVSDEFCQNALAKILLYKLELTIDEKLAFYLKRDRFSFSTLTLDEVNKLVWCLGKLGKSELLMRFYQFDKTVQKYMMQRFKNSDIDEVTQQIEHELNNMFKFYIPILNL